MGLDQQRTKLGLKRILAVKVSFESVHTIFYGIKSAIGKPQTGHGSYDATRSDEKGEMFRRLHW